MVIMSDKTFLVAVKLRSAPTQEFRVDAPNPIQARKMAETQYVKKNVIGVRPA